MLSKRPPKKPPPPDPNRSGPPKPKGKGKAKVATLEEEEPTNQSTIESSLEEEIPINESKVAQKCQLQDKAEYKFAWEGHDEQEDKPTLAELKHFIKYAKEIKDLDAEATTISIETSEASRPTLIWSASSNQYLQPPRRGGHSSSALSRVSKRPRSPSPYESCSSSGGHGGTIEARPPPGWHQQYNPEEENRLLWEEL